MIPADPEIYNSFVSFSAIILGACVGSFLNVCILRIPEEKNIIWLRSHCTACGKTLSAIDLIPILSYLFLFGKCRNCKASISPRYLFIELITALLFYIGVVYFDFNNYPASSLIFIYFSCIMICIIFIDIDHYIIPDRFSFGLMVSGLLLASFNSPPLNSNFLYGSLSKLWYMRTLNSLYGLLVGGGVFLLIFYSAELYYSRKGIEAFGFGDVKLAAGIGAFLGWKLIFLMMFSSFFIGALLSIPAILFGGKGLKSQIPFAPAMCIAGILVFLFGENLYSFWSNFGLDYY